MHQKIYELYKAVEENKSNEIIENLISTLKTDIPNVFTEVINIIFLNTLREENEKLAQTLLNHGVDYQDHKLFLEVIKHDFYYLAIDFINLGADIFQEHIEAAYSVGDAIEGEGYEIYTALMNAKVWDASLKIKLNKDFSNLPLESKSFQVKIPELTDLLNVDLIDDLVSGGVYGVNPPEPFEKRIQKQFMDINSFKNQLFAKHCFTYYVNLITSKDCSTTPWQLEALKSTQANLDKYLENRKQAILSKTGPLQILCIKAINNNIGKLVESGDLDKAEALTYIDYMPIELQEKYHNIVEVLELNDFREVIGEMHNSIQIS